MAEKELSILVKAKGALAAAGQIGKVDSAVGNLSQTASRTGKLALAGIGAGAIVAGGLITRGVMGGLSSLETLESAVTSVDGAISQMGLSGQLTGAEIATWANQIESDIGAAFDDKDITQATSTLIRFGKVTPQNLKPAMVVMTDLAAKTGDVDSAATLLAKALADPEKAAGKLAKSGVILTKAEQDQIKAFEKAGDSAGAQKVILDSLARTTKGAAEASQGPYKRAMSVLKDVTEDAEKALAVGFLPVIEKVADLLSTELAKPQTLASIKEFGTSLAGGLSGLIDTARGLPWGAIGDALKIGGAGAKAVLDAFLGMPPWVQTAIATGWGLNKVTGGFVTDIIGTLGSGLIKGVLGMNAGVVNINAASVNGAGAAGAAKGGSSLLGALGVAAVIDVVAAEVVGPIVRDWALKNGLAGSGDTAGKTDSQLARERADAAMKEQTSLLDVIGRNTADVSHETRDTRAAVNAAKDAIVRQKLSVAVSLSNKVYLSAREVVSTTTQTKILAGGIQQI